MVQGFFILSSFLLSYRLLTEFERENVFDHKKIMEILLKYFIRRFFRIYVVYIAFCALVKFGPHIFTGFHGDPETFASFYELITFSRNGWNHLWTVSPEIYFYLCIPFICLVTYIIDERCIRKSSLLSSFFVGKLLRFCLIG